MVNTILTVPYSSLLIFNEKKLIDTKMEDSETLLVSIISEIFDTFKRMESKGASELYKKMNIDFHMKSTITYNNECLIEYKYKEDNGVLKTFNFSNCSAEFKERIINTSFLDYISKLPILPTYPGYIYQELEDIEDMNTITIDFDRGYIDYDFDVSEDTVEAIQCFNDYFTELSLDENTRCLYFKVRLD